MSKNIIIGEIQNSKPYISKINAILKKELISKKYKIETKIVDEEDWEERIDSIKKGKYDYIIDSFFIQTDRMKKVDFTYSFATIIPRVIYDPDTTKTNTMKYFNYLLKIWAKPFIYLIILAIIVGIIINISHYKKNKNGFVQSVYHSIAGFFGQTGGILSDGDSNVNNIFKILTTLFCFFIIYIFTIFIQSSTTAQSVFFFNKSNKLENNLRGEKILVTTTKKLKQNYNNNLDPVESLILHQKAIPAFLPDNFKELGISAIQYYMENKEKENLNGIILIPFAGTVSNKTVNEIANKYKLKLSTLIVGSFKLAIPVNKKKKKLMEDLDIIIYKLIQDHTLFEICSKFAKADELLC